LQNTLARRELKSEVFYRIVRANKMGKVPPETIQQILDATDIVELISSYIQLQRAGANYKAVCPFHVEKSPSFNVNPQRQRFKCFGCQAGGDAINFVKDYEGMSFTDAVQKLADRAGVTIVEDVYDAKADARRQSRQHLIKLQKDAAEFYNNLLFRNSCADEARKYLTSRQISQDVARRWLFGYAPENQSIFFQWAQQAGWSETQLVDAGLAAYRDENYPQRGTYARFRHRLMFPVANDYGDTIAFSGRVLSKDQKGGKYVNSPETVLFDKSKTFYGFDKTKRAVIREKKAIIFEGQLDLIAAYEAGLENGVAGLGTAFTEGHARLLKRQTDEAVLCYDSDKAGIAAATKAFRVLAPAGVLVRFALLPPGEDPDSLIQKEGPAVLQEIIAGAPEYFDFQIDRRGSALTTGPLRDRLNYAKELAFDIALIEDKMVQDSLINRISVRLKVGEEDIRKNVSNAKRDQERGKQAAARRDAAQKARGGQSNLPQRPGQQPQEEPVREIEITNKSIRFLCQMLLVSPEVKAKYRGETPPEFFQRLPETELLAMLWAADFDPASPSNVSAFASSLPPSEGKLVSTLLDEPQPPEAEIIASTCLQKLYRQSLEMRVTELSAQLGAPDLSFEQIEMLQKEKIDLRRQLNDIPRHFSV